MFSNERHASDDRRSQKRKKKKRRPAFDDAVPFSTLSLSFFLSQHASLLPSLKTPHNLNINSPTTTTFSRSKKKAVHKASAGDDKRLQSTLKRLGVHQIPGIEEVAIYHDDGSVVHFGTPKVQASINANTFVVSGPSSIKSADEMMPAGLQGMSPEQLQMLIQQMQMQQQAAQAGGAGAGGAGGAAAALEAGGDDDDDIPELVENVE